MRIEKDKWRHFFVGIVMGAVLQSFFLFLLSPHFILTIFLSLLFSVVIGYGFELYSKFTGKGHYDILDVVADIIGAVLGIAVVVIIHLV